MTGKPAAPSGLRIIHAIVFLGFASAAVAGTHQELLQLWRCLTEPYSSGTPPLPIACASGAVAAVMAVVLIARLALGRTVPLWVSVLLLLSFAGSLSLLTADPKQRSVPGANVKSLDQAQLLHQQINNVLQETGRVPASTDVLRLDGSSPFLARFTALPWHVETVKRTDALPDGARPGWYLFQPSDDGASFSFTAVGIDDDGLPSLLRHDGKPIEYRGAYNPDAAR